MKRDFTNCTKLMKTTMVEHAAYIRACAACKNLNLDKHKDDINNEMTKSNKNEKKKKAMQRLGITVNIKCVILLIGSVWRHWDISTTDEYLLHVVYINYTFVKILLQFTKFQMMTIPTMVDMHRVKCPLEGQWNEWWPIWCWYGLSCIFTAGGLSFVLLFS